MSELKRYVVTGICVLWIWALACSPPTYDASPAPHSDLVHGWLTWNDAASPVVRLAVSIPAEQLLATVDPGVRAPDRLLLSASLLDNSGRNVGGSVWTSDIDLPLRPGSRFERQVELPVEPGRQELVVGVIWRGQQLLPEWRRRFNVPNPDVDMLVLGEPQFLQSQVQESNVAATWGINVGQYYDDHAGPVRVRATIYDPQPTVMADSFVVHSRVDDRQARSVWEGQQKIRRLGSVTEFEIDVPILALGSYRVHLELFSGERRSGSSGRFEVGFGDLATLGAIDGGLDLLEFLVPAEQFEKLRQAEPEQRSELWKQYWQSRDPVPATATNEYRDEVMRRIRYANTHFSASDLGWRTDRGRVYIKLGAPDEIDSLQNPEAFDRLERWTYHDGNKVLVFRDRDGRGDFKLVRSNVDGSWMRASEASENR